MKSPNGTLSPYSFGHKWKDGRYVKFLIESAVLTPNSLRTDIPLKALNLHFGVNFSIVSQVNPHINLFFFSSRGAVGRPVTHRRGRGWRGGYLGSAIETVRCLCGVISSLVPNIRHKAVFWERSSPQDASVHTFDMSPPLDMSDALLPIWVRVVPISR